MGKLKNKVSLITGAASGIGKEMALLFAAEGSQVVAVDFNQKRLDALKEEAKAAGHDLLTLVADLTSQENIDNSVNSAVSTYGTLDILVNNAGVMDNFEPAGELSDAVFEKVMRINVEAPLRLIRKALEIFLPKESGVIINVASLAGLNGARGGAAYTMSKHAVVGLTKNTGFIYAKNGIRCNAIAPGGVATNIQETIDPSKMSALGQKSMAPGLGLNPRLGNPSELASAALFLASDDASFVNGEVIVVDGGWSAY